MNAFEQCREMLAGEECVWMHPYSIHPVIAAAGDDWERTFRPHHADDPLRDYEFGTLFGTRLVLDPQLADDDGYADVFALKDGERVVLGRLPAAVPSGEAK